MARLSALALVLLLAALPASAEAATKRGVSAKVARKTLTIKGSKKADKITLRAGRGKTLEIDVGGSSRAEFRFKRSKFKKIAIAGGRGNDRINVGAETVKVDGGSGSDRLTAAGTTGADELAVARVGTTLRLSRAGRSAVDATKVERLLLGLARDGAADNVVVRGTSGADAITVSGSGQRFDVKGLAVPLTATGADPGADRVTVDGAEGADVISAQKLAAAAVPLTAEGGLGDDSVSGGEGGDMLNGGEGNDTLGGGGGGDSATGGRGDDTATLGAGDDAYRWEPGDGSDRVDGQEGVDRVAAGGTDGPDNFTLSPGVRITRDDGSVDAAGVEGVDLAPRAGGDRIAVTGTAGADSIGISGNPGGVSIAGPVPIAIVAPEASDVLAVDAGAGDDTVDASGLAAGTPQLFVVGGEGTDALTGGQGSDAFTSGAADGSDTVNGGGGADRVTYSGSDGADALRIAPAGDRVQISNGAPVVVDAGSVEAVNVNPLGGADDVAIDGTGGDDMLSLTGGAPLLTVAGLPAPVELGGVEGGDHVSVNGLAGADTIATTLAQGAPGVAAGGGDGTGDRLVVNGSDADDTVEATAVGAAVRVTHNGTVIDAAGVENLTANAVGGADRLTLGDLTGTGMTAAAFDLAAAGGGTTPDGQADTVVRVGSAGDDSITTPGNASGGVNVTGVVPALTVSRADPADGLIVALGTGADVLDASALPAGRMALTVDGGTAGDVLIGSPGDDFFDGGDGDDVALMGAGNDTFFWEPGDDNDTIEGQAGTSDRLAFNENSASEVIDIAANGGRVRLLRDVASVVMDMNDVERIDVNPSVGVDGVLVQDTSGTDLTQVTVDLAALGTTAPDGQADSVVQEGTNGNNIVSVGGSGASGATVTGLAPALTVLHAAVPADGLRINGLGAADAINASGLKADAAKLTIDGGAGADQLTGGDGDDLLIGGPDMDTMHGGPGNDTFVSEPGDSVFQDGP